MLYHLGTEHRKVLLFFDIIGFSSLVERNDAFDANDGKPHDIALMFPVFYENMVNLRFSNDYQEERKIKFLWMSDSIVISTNVNNANILIEELIYLQNQFYCGEMAFRGAICIGNLFHQGNVWGEPLVRAAHLEKNKAQNPRIIVSKDELIQLELPMRYLQYFEQDEKNTEFYSFDPFKPNIEMLLANETKIIHSTISVYKKMILNNYNTAPDYKDKSKWTWMAKKLVESIRVKEEDLRMRLNTESKHGKLKCNLDDYLTELCSIC